jgi:hypothetical protein
VLPRDKRVPLEILQYTIGVFDIETLFVLYKAVEGVLGRPELVWLVFTSRVVLLATRYERHHEEDDR